MNKYCFSYTIGKLLLGNSWQSVSILTTLIMSLFLIGCTNSTIEPKTESYPGELNQPHTPSSFQSALPITLTPTWTPTATPIFTSVLDFQATPSPIPHIPKPTQMPTITSSFMPTPVNLPELLVAVIEVKQKGEANEFYEIWLINTLTGEKQLVFTTASGTQSAQMMWGDDKSDILYVAETEGTREEPVTWQLYAVNYRTGSNQAFFTKPLEGIPTLLDLSAQGKWLRVRVDYPVAGSLEWWFVNTEDGTIIKNDRNDPYLSGFVWSPDEPDVFAYSQESSINDGVKVPQSIIVREVSNFEVLDSIKYQYTSWGGEPLLMWDSSSPEQIIFFTLGEMYLVDLFQKQWKLIARGLDVFPGDDYTQLLKSPSGQWAVTTTFIRAIKLDDTPKVIERFEDKIGQRNQFLSWYDDKDWMIISTQDGKIQVYELGNKFDLIREINPNDYGIASSGGYTLLAKPLE